MAADLPEDILEAILNYGKPIINRGLLADLRARGDAAFEQALSCLTKDGYLMESVDGFSLTDTGRKKAASVARKHAVLANFLRDVLGARPDEASKEACILEHKISTETINKLDTFMDEQAPAVPVYTDHQKLTQANPIVPLIECSEGSLLHVAMIESFSKHSRLIDLGVIPGELITLRRKLDNDAVVIKVKGYDIALSPEVAANIMVERCCVQ